MSSESEATTPAAGAARTTAATIGGRGARVQGRVQATDGAAVAGATVTVLARRLRQDDLQLASTKTGADGSYAATYAAHLAQVDLVVRAVHGDATATSSVVVGAGPDETVDLVLGGAYLGPSDFARLGAAITPVLRGDGVSGTLADFTEDEVALLAVKSGAEPAELVLLRQAAALAARTKLSAELFYALGRQRIPLTFAAIVTTDPQRRRDAIARALAGNQVPASAAKTLEGELAALEKLTVDEALRAPKTPTESTLGSLLGAAGITASQQTQLVALQVKTGGKPDAFWKAVRDGGVLGQPDIDRLQDTLRLAALTFGHVPLVQALQAKKYAAPADLAKLEKPDWQALVASAGMPPDLAAAGLTTDAYVARIAAAVEDAVPTARVAARAAPLAGG